VIGPRLRNHLRSFAKKVPLSFREKFADLIALDQGFEDFFARANYNSDGLITFHNIDCLSSPEFLSAYKAGEALGSWKGADIRWRAYICSWFSRHCMSLDGDFVECGVNKGGMALTNIKYSNIDKSSKQYYLFDTYDGLHENLFTKEEKEIGVQPGRYESCFEQVLSTFKEYSNVVLVKGEVPETLSQVSIDQVAYLSIDMNCVVPEIEALQFFWDKLVLGAVVVLDDYGWPNHYLQKKAFDSFAVSKNIRICQLPTGQGLIIKSTN